VERLLTTSEIAQLLRVSADWVKHWRTRRSQGGPPFLKIGRLVRYRSGDVLRFLNRHVVRIRRRS
jgi:predicted DNA-binding transcriptional regulator AlpA